MHPYRKLQQLCIGLIMSPCAFAITLDPIQIETTQGNLLYAEIPFHNVNPNTVLHVELASVEDLRALGARHQPPRALNFFTRKNAKGEGAIVITSSQPIYEKELDIIIKIKTGQQTRLQHIQRQIRPAETTKKTTPSLNEQPLLPTYVVSEQEIALNLPVSTQMRQPPAMQSSKPTSTINTPILAEEKVLRTQTVTPPPMQVIQAAPLPPKQTTPAASVPRQTSVQTSATPTAVPNTQTTAQSPAAKVSVASAPTRPTSHQAETPPIAKAPVPAPVITPAPVPVPQPTLEAEVETSTPHPVEETIVAENKVAESKVDTPTETSSELKPEAKATTKAAAKPTETQIHTSAASTKHVVKANESLWRIASQIARQSDQSIHDVMQHIQQQNTHAFVNGDINRLKQGVVLNLTGSDSPAQVQAKKTKRVSEGQASQVKTKYKLQDAQMRLVGEHDSGKATGTDKKTHPSANTSTELATKVMTSREKSVKLQKVVQALDIQLQQKDHKIKLLNAKLAQLEAQLKRQQQNAKKP